MRSALEYFHEAARLEQMARGAVSDETRGKFLVKADRCRKLAEEAQSQDISQIQMLRELS
jgi:hypothetical protein